MIIRYGTEEYTDNKKKLVRYNFFKDEIDGGKDAIYGLDIPLMRLVHVAQGGAEGYGPEKRVILLHGPVGSSKINHRASASRRASSTTRDARRRAVHLRLGEPRRRRHGWSRKRAFPLPHARGAAAPHPPAWRDARFASSACPTFAFQVKVERRPRSRLPLHLQSKLMEQVRRRLGQGHAARARAAPGAQREGPRRHRHLPAEGREEPGLDRADGRHQLPEDRRIRFGFDPRAFNFDGEFNIANRGVVEFIEVLKLDVAFLYDLLGASQEHKIKPKKFAQTDIDEVIIGHTNEAEYKKLLNNEFMEACAIARSRSTSRTSRRVSEEIRIYEKDFNKEKIRGKHIAPHTLEVAAMWAVLTRLDDPKKHNLSCCRK
jgi:serine protein kinase